ncbi:tetratricopeptide repeat protein [Streptomyces sp. NPDC051018]|uniref:tetratricopeptide repeat protein n=1 Tax=Streptomyces sp. NPDC051018 TaxID=3365639 RepID=UPI0037BAD347
MPIYTFSLQAITDQQPLAGDLLRLLGWLAPSPLPRDVLRELPTDLSEDPFAVEEALALLHDYSMITLTRRTVAVHALVQAVARAPDAADPNRTGEAIARARRYATEMLERALPENPLLNISGWSRWRELLPHLRALTDRTPAEGDLCVAGLLVAASGFLQGDGSPATAVSCAQRAVTIYRRLEGSDHPDTLFARSFLASAHRAAGDLDSAAPLHEQLLADHERLHGPDHPDTLTARANLAYLHGLRGQSAAARDLHERNLTDMQRVYGSDHPHTVNARANLAAAYRDLGEVQKAIGLHREAVADSERVHGPDHPETITARSNLACALHLAGDFDAALTLHGRVLADRERLYGHEHHLTDLAREFFQGTRTARDREQR